MFDVGGVLERVAGVEQWLEPWRQRLGMAEDVLAAAMARVDPDGGMQTGRMTEAEFRQRSAGALGLSDTQADAFLRDMWDWCCGELDEELLAYAASLRSTYRTAILSNSADGARREEERRYGFAAYFDPIVYSHEVGLAKPDPRIYTSTCELLGVAPEEVVFLDDTEISVDGANQVGMRGVLHRDTASSIRAIDVRRFAAGAP